MKETLGLCFAATLVAFGCGIDGHPPAGSTEPLGHQSEAVVSPSTTRHRETLSQGSYHGCALGRNGAVYCSGWNSDGQIGDGTTVSYRTIPVAVSGLSNQVSVGVGSYTSCAVAGDGTVRCWGANSSGQVGNGTQGGPFGTPGIHGGYNTPQQVLANLGFFGTPPLGMIVEVVGGDDFTCARDATGSVWCWGHNGFGQLGTTTSPNILSTMALPVQGISNAIQVVAGDVHACALLADHTVHCWGDNTHGQYGNGTTSGGGPTPVQVPNLSNVTSIAASGYGACALMSDSTVQCWGDNGVGQMGNGTESSPQLTPTSVDHGNLTNVASISGGPWTTCAVLATGVAYCWGYNADGQTGSGSTTTVLPSPTQVGATGSAHIAEIGMGALSGCARTVDGNLWCWGDNSYGELGNGTTTSSDVPVHNDIPQSISPAQRIVAGETACAIESASGRVACWGDNSKGQIGDGTTTDRTTPTLVSGLTHVVGLAGEWAANCALRGDGTVWCWGLYAWIASGGLQDSHVPRQVTSLANDVVALTTGCALTSTGTVWCWGDNSFGAVGDGTTSGDDGLGNRLTPVAVIGLSDPASAHVAAIAGADDHRCALKTDGTVWCWGRDNYGQLGDGTSGLNNIQTTPVHVQGLSNAVAIACGYSVSCAVKADGTAWCWGMNRDGQIGNGTSSDSYSAATTPVQVSGISDAVAISASNIDFGVDDNNANIFYGGANCVIRASGALLCWGFNNQCQVGNGTCSPALTGVTSPVAVTGMGNNVINVASGYDFTMALRADGTLWWWGGALYDSAANPASSTPVQITSLSP
jgi:alpha-tubulin suppressor-like RCC1 family protein